MPPGRRWLRLDAEWDESGWIIGLHGLAQLAWIRLLCHVKLRGSMGRCKALPAPAAARLWRLPERHVAAMLEAAEADGALATENGEWVLTKWAEYQEVDRTAADRMRRMRERQASSGDDGSVTNGYGALRRNTPVTRHATETPGTTTPTSSLRSEEPPAGPAPKKRASQLPTGWRPSPAHTQLAAELHVNVGAEAEKFRDHATANGRSQIDWDAAFRNWLRHAPQYANGRGRAPPAARVQSPTLNLQTTE